MSDKIAQPIHLKSLQEDIGRLWKDDVGTESPVNSNAQNKTPVVAPIFCQKGDMAKVSMCVSQHMIKFLFGVIPLKNWFGRFLI